MKIFSVLCLVLSGSLLNSALASDHPTVFFLIGEQEYETKITLPKFAQTELLPRGIHCVFSHVSETDPNDFPHMDTLVDADLLFISVRRRTPPKAQMEALQEYLRRGKPVIGIRTASHAFDREVPDDQHVRWASFDQDILGARYLGHYGNKPPLDPPTQITIRPVMKNHPIVEGIASASFRSTSHLYLNRDLAPGVQVLLDGEILGQDKIEPVAWIRVTEGQNRVFYTSLGNPEDFQSEPFRKLLLQAIQWSLPKPSPKPSRQEP